MPKGGEKLGCFFRASPEVPGVTSTVITAPDADICFVVSAGYPLIVHVATMIINIVT